MSRIVIVEDDKSIATGLAMNFRYEGFDVRHALDGPEGLRLAMEPGTDLVILDIMLPGLNGYELMKELRQRNARVPVLVLSAKGSESDKITGLDVGADDYVTKPFALGELMARVKALLRRSQTPRVIHFGTVEVDLDTQLVKRGGEPVLFTPQEFRLLRTFLESEGRAMSREQLLNLAWGIEYEGTARTVDTFVRQLRVKLELDSEDPKHFLTVRGHGYRFGT